MRQSPYIIRLNVKLVLQLLFGILIAALVIPIFLGGTVTAQENSVITADNASRLQILKTWNHDLDPATLLGDDLVPLPDYEAINWLSTQMINSDGTRIAHVTKKRVLWLTNPQTNMERAIILGSVSNWHISPDLQWLATAGRHWNVWNIAKIPLLSAEERSIPCTFTPIHSSINLRSGPSKQFDSVGYGYATKPLEVLLTTIDEAWGMVRQDNRTMWFDRSLGTLTGNCNTLPIYLVPGSEDFQTDSSAPVEFTPNSRYLLESHYYDNRLMAWDVTRGVVVYEVNSNFPIVYSPNGRYMVDNNYQIFEVDTGTKVLSKRFGYYNRYDASPLTSLVFTPDETMIAVSRADSTVRLYDVKSSKEIAVIILANGQSHQLAFSPDGRWLAVVDGPHSLVVWDTTLQKTAYIIDIPLMLEEPSYSELNTKPNPTYPIFFSPDSKTLFFYREVQRSFASNTLVAWDVETNQMKYSVVDDGLNPYLTEDFINRSYLFLSSSNPILGVYWYLSQPRETAMALVDAQ